MTEIRLRELLSGLDTGDIILSWLSDQINKDMEAFAEWVTENGWFYRSFFKVWEKRGCENKTTAQLREIWEMETGRKEATE